MSTACTFCGKPGQWNRDAVWCCNRLKCVRQFNAAVDREMDACAIARAKGLKVTIDQFRCEDYVQQERVEKHSDPVRTHPWFSRPSNAGDNRFCN